MGGVMLSLFLASLDQTVVGTALPRIVADLGDFDRFTWITGAYLVASTTVVPLVGRLTDIYGRKGFYIAGIAVFLVGSLLCGMSQSMDQLIAFRVIQGLGAGSIFAISFVTVGDLFSPAERGKYQGFVAAVFGFSAVLGPTAGGFITDTLSWHWVFYINLPTGIPIILLFIRFFPSPRPSLTGHRLDVAGIVTLILAVVPLLVGLTWGGAQYDWVSPQVVGALAMAGVMAAIFIAVEMHASDPIMPLEIYRNRVVSVSLIGVFATGIGMFGSAVFVPLFFQGVLGASATSSGSFLTPMMLSMVLAAIASGQSLSRFGGHYRLQALIGLAAMSTGMFLASRMTADTSYGSAVVNIVIIGLGLGVTFPAYTIAIQNAVPHSLLGVATSTMQFYRSIGGVFGLAVFGSFMTSRFASSMSAALSPALKAALPPGRLADLSNNPEQLVAPDAAASLRETFAGAGPQSAELAGQFLLTLRSTLALVIGDIFLIAMLVSALALVATLFLKEVPLRREVRGRRMT
jgi:EmrB/QacA subfamily drug resistance transporter